MPFPEMPLALLYVASALREAGIGVDIVDTRIGDTIPTGPYLYAGITTNTGPQIKYALQAAGEIRRLMPGVPIVWGGVHPSLMPQQTLCNPFVDAVVVGEGENAAVGFAHCGVDGICSGFNVNMDAIPIELPYDLLRMDKYAFPCFAVHTSRGCPYRCGFCYNTAYNKRRWRGKSAGRVVDEIEYVVNRFGVRDIGFTEDEFCIDVDRVRAICEGVLRRGLDITWVSFCRVDTFERFTDADLKLLERSGCISLSFGCESGSQRILDEVIQKDATVEQMITATERMSRTGMRQVVSFICGFPTETAQDMALTIALVERLAALNPQMYPNGVLMYTPYPGTPLFDRVVSEYGYKPPASLEAWADFGIFRNVGATPWHSKAYARRCKAMSIATRFPFWHDFTCAEIRRLIGTTRFGRFPYSIAAVVLSKLARFRWKRQLWRFPIEWLVLERLLNKLRGYV